MEEKLDRLEKKLEILRELLIAIRNNMIAKEDLYLFKNRIT